MAGHGFGLEAAVSFGPLTAGTHCSQLGGSMSQRPGRGQWQVPLAGPHASALSAVRKHTVRRQHSKCEAGIRWISCTAQGIEGCCICVGRGVVWCGVVWCGVVWCGVV